MATLKTNLIEPSTGTTLTVGESGGDLVMGADSLKANTLKSRTQPIVTSFTTVESTTWTAPAGVTEVEYLVVAGGGAGGRHSGGGGGAGGFRTGTLSVTPSSSYTVTVGAGGASNTSGAAAAANDGDDSVFSSITSTGGGAGAVSGAGGRSGGSGGGDAGWAAAGAGNTPSTSPSQGNDGGGNAAASTGSGGGGANSAGTYGGTTAGGNGGPGGTGGAGTSSSITGTFVFYSGGGGGGTDSTSAVGAGGSGGGGNGANTSGGPGSAGTNGLGGGGGGSATASDDSGAGGSGIVVLKYTPPTGTPKTLFVSNGSGVVSSVDSGWGGVQVLLSTQTASNVGSIDFTTGIDSTYGEYVFEFIDCQPITDNVGFGFQANTSGQSGYDEVITSSFFVAQLRNDNTSAALQYQGGDDQAQGTGLQHLASGIGSGAKESGSGEFHLFNPASTTYVKQFYGRVQIYHASDYAIDNYAAGYVNVTAAITNITFKFSSGNINAGTIKMYGIK